MKTALVIGATGMVGKQLILQLINSPSYDKVISFGRRACGLSHSKLTEHIINFDESEDWKKLVKGDVLFSCLGTTLAQAKSKEAQYKVDFTYQYRMAKIAEENQVPCYILISSTGANAASSNFYLRMKGELDDAVLALQFKSLSILRPAQLSGDRTMKRTAEHLAIKVMKGLNKLGLFLKFRPIEAQTLAQKMMLAAEENHIKIYDMEEVHELNSI